MRSPLRYDGTRVKKIPVRLGAASYDVLIANGLLRKAGRLIRKRTDGAIQSEMRRIDESKSAAGMPRAPFPYKNPGLFSMAGAFLAGILVSLLSRELLAEEKFEDEKLRTYLGVGAD